MSCHPNPTFVSYVGQYVTRFEKIVTERCGTRHTVAMVNGTEALHAALLLVGVQAKDLVVTQALTFVATCNAISFCGAEPVFVDVQEQTLGMDPVCLEEFLTNGSYWDDDGTCREKSTGHTGVHVGENCILNSASLIEHDATIGDHCHISTGAVVNGGCDAGNGVFIGSNAVLRNGVRICDDVVIGAGSVVTQTITEPGVWFGNPARHHGGDKTGPENGVRTG